MLNQSPPKRSLFLPLILIPAFIILVYGNTLRVPFHFDDQGLIERNTAIRDFYDPLRAIISTDPGHRHRPLLMVSLAFSYHFSGNNVFGYHFFNILLHSLSTILIFAICKILYRLVKGRRLCAQKKNIPRVSVAAILLAVLFYAVQPMNIEAITYLSGRSSSMSTFFLLLSFYLFFKSRLHGASDVSFKKGVYIGASVLTYCLSIASKEIGIVLPCLLLAADYYFSFSSKQENNGGVTCFFDYLKKHGISLAPFFIVIVIVFAIRFHIQGAILEKNSAYLNLYSRASYFYTQANVIFYYYINKLFFPYNQNIDIYFDIYESPLNIPTIIAGVLLVFFIALAVKKRLSAPWFSFAVFWFFITLSPTSTLIPIIDVAVERRLYLPGISIIFLLLHFTPGISWKKILLFLLSLHFFSTNAILRNFSFKDSSTLWHDSASKSVREPRPHFNYAKTLKKTGQHTKAIAEFNKALSIKYSPYNHEIHNSLGVIYMERGLYQKAIEEFTESIKLRHRSDFPHNNLGSAYIKLGKIKEAEASLLTAISINPDNTEARNNLGVIYAKKGMYVEAYKEFKAILKKDPRNEVKKNLEKLELILSGRSAKKEHTELK